MKCKHCETEVDVCEAPCCQNKFNIGDEIIHYEDDIHVCSEDCLEEMIDPVRWYSEVIK